jgi:hypothetical protein
VQPLFTFQPIGPAPGSESEGPAEIAFAPALFPEGLNNGVFIGFHGRFDAHGTANEENPLVYCDLNSGVYFHFINNDEPAIGHLDALLATEDSLYVADLTGQGSIFSNSATGVIYQIRAYTPIHLTVSLSGDIVTIGWNSQPGVTYRVEYKDHLPSPGWLTLQDNFIATGTWSSVPDNVSNARHRFYRVVRLK